jgi:hypothetical protein
MSAFCQRGNEDVTIVADIRLMTSQRNEVLELVLRHELEPADFEWIEEQVDGDLASVLTVRGPDRFYRVFVQGTYGDRHVPFSPA